MSDINNAALALNLKARKVLKEHAMVRTLAKALKSEAARASIGTALRRGKLNSTSQARAKAHAARRAIESLGAIPGFFAGVVRFGEGFDGICIDADTARQLKSLMVCCDAIKDHKSDGDTATTGADVTEDAAPAATDATTDAVATVGE